ncbi:hypothetical protein [Bordetella sp. N]|uniref:hypothetical protein n=1 Tax=Bordetella sp. N TaxID=1746199 RepID=UPI000710C6E1|nr:hypothetical protein [Bordetella sp. N]ALM81708.1 hypothetical protein ASB57_00870 [Bordetella sp. N]
MYSTITAATPASAGGVLHDATVADGPMRPGPQATSRRVPTRPGLLAASGSSGTEARLIRSAPGQGRAGRAGMPAAAAGADDAARAFISPSWRDATAFAAFWNQPRGIEQLPKQARSVYAATHAPKNVAHLRDEDRLFRWVPRGSVAQHGQPGLQVPLRGQDGDTKILDHRKWVLHVTLIKAVLGPTQMDQSATTVTSADDAVAALQDRENSAWFKPPKVKAKDVSPNCALVSQWESAGPETSDHAHWVKMEVTVRELREQGAELFLVSRPDARGLAKVGRLFNDARGKAHARHDPGHFIVIPPDGKTTVLMRRSGS